MMMEGGEGSSAPMEGAVVSTGSGSDGVGTAESAGIIVVSSGGASLEGAPPLVDEDEALPPAIAIAAGDGQSGGCSATSTERLKLVFYPTHINRKRRAQCHVWTSTTYITIL